LRHHSDPCLRGRTPRIEAITVELSVLTRVLVTNVERSGHQRGSHSHSADGRHGTGDLSEDAQGLSKCGLARRFLARSRATRCSG